MQKIVHKHKRARGRQWLAARSSNRDRQGRHAAAAPLAARQSPRPDRRRDRHRQDGLAAGPGRGLLGAAACRCSWPTSRAISSGIARPARANPKLARARRARSASPTTRSAAFPIVFWDLFGEQGHPIRTTVSEMGPLLLARLLGLNETQEGVLDVAFKVADDQGLLLLDLKDLRALLNFVGEHAQGAVARVRPGQHRLGRRDPAPAADPRAAGRRPLLRRAGARHQGSDAHRPRPARASSTCSPPTS